MNDLLKLLSLLSIAFLMSCNAAEKKPLNVLLITVDDMNYNSIGVYGCPVPNTTPNIDRLSEQGIRFNQSYVTIAVCQPCRATIMTGMYPHNSGVTAFNHIPEDALVPLLPEELQKAGYLTGVLGKVMHSSPKKSMAYWDEAIDGLKDFGLLGFGRDKDLYYKHFSEFIKSAQKEKKPFFMMANSHDPHRPFALSDQENGAWKDRSIVMPSKVFSPEEVVVPSFLPDIPEVRLEVSEYYSSVRRADDMVGAVIRALEESGESDNTMVIFMSDHGMALPFAKTNCYLNSNRSPLIILHPALKARGAVDKNHFIATIDYLPTILDAVGLPIPNNIDQESFLPVVFGDIQKNRSHVFVEFSETSGPIRYPMRAVHTAEYTYIYNPWSDGVDAFRNDGMSGRSFKAMKKAGEKDASISAIVEFYLHRVPEELYDTAKDPDGLDNQINNPEYIAQLEEARGLLLGHLEAQNDPALEAFIHREDEDYRLKFMKEQKQLGELAKKRKRGER